MMENLVDRVGTFGSVSYSRSVFVLVTHQPTTQRVVHLPDHLPGLT